MKKHVLKLMGVLAISATAFGIAPGLMTPPTTEGIDVTGSNTEVRVTANVVDGVAVNEGSPIDFGNLIRGKDVYTPGEIINDRTPGWVEYRADKGTNSIKSKLLNEKITLTWRENNGSTGEGEQDRLYNVTVTGLSTEGEQISLINGKAKRTLNAHFKAYDNASGENDLDNGNLGDNQKLGAYAGYVIVEATIEQ